MVFDSDNQHRREIVNCEYVEDETVESVVPCTSNDSSVVQDYMNLFDIDVNEVMDCNVATVESAENCFEFH